MPIGASCLGSAWRNLEGKSDQYEHKSLAWLRPDKIDVAIVVM